MRWLVLLLFVAGCVSNGSSNSDVVDAEQVAPDLTSGTPDVSVDTAQLVSCNDHGACKADEYCDVNGYCRTRKAAGERCDGLVLSGTDVNAACLDNACYRDPFKSASYCASSTEGCSVNGQTVAKDLIVCDEAGSGFKTCEGQGQWSESTSCEGQSACYAYAPDKDSKYTGMTAKQVCKNGEGCTPATPTCEGCLAYLTVDSNTGSCRTDCKDAQGNDDDSLCWSLAKCINGVCLPTSLKPVGTTCLDNAECQDKFCAPAANESGSLTVSKICCESACDSPCHACNSEGKCVPLALNADGSGQLDSRCSADDATSCGNNGRCDGSGSCAKWDNTTICKARRCESVNGTVFSYPPAFCDGQGACTAVVGDQCADGCDSINTTQCKGTTPCDSHSDCVVGQYCGKSGTCLNKLKNYESCKDVVGTDGSNQPLSSHNACESGQCSADETDGSEICIPLGSCLYGGKVYAKDAIRCNGDDNELVCAGKTGWQNSTICKAQLCKLAEGTGLIEKRCTNGSGCNGQCKACDGFLNATLEGCPNSCSKDSDCYDTHYCKDSVCVDRVPAGTICQTGDESVGCQPGLYCVASATDGEKVCCPLNCGDCEYCALTVDPVTEDAEWVCLTRDAGYVDGQCKEPAGSQPHPDCATFACTGKQGEGCQFPVGKPCGAQFTCQDGRKSTYTCQADGSCQATVETCATSECLDATSCKPACNSHADCLTLDSAKCLGSDGSNKCYCDNTDGFCLPRLKSGKRCDKRSKPKFPASDDEVCVNGLKCREDTLSYTTGTTNELAGFFCATDTQCVDASSSSATSASVYSIGYVHCAPQGSDGTQYWTCSDSGGTATWVKASQKCQTQLFPGCSYGSLGANSGYRQNVCTSGTGSSKGCQQSSCTSCNGYKHPSDDTYACESNCHTCTIFNCGIFTPVSGKPSTTMTSAGDIVIIDPICCNKYNSTKCLSGYTCKSGDICSTP